MRRGGAVQDFWQIYFIITQKDSPEGVDALSLGSSWGVLSAAGDAAEVGSGVATSKAGADVRCKLRYLNVHHLYRSFVCVGAPPSGRLNCTCFCDVKEETRTLPQGLDRRQRPRLSVTRRADRSHRPGQVSLSCVSQNARKRLSGLCFYRDPSLRHDAPIDFRCPCSTPSR